MAYTPPRSYVTADSIGGLQAAEMQLANHFANEARIQQAADERAVNADNDTDRFRWSAQNQANLSNANFSRQDRAFDQANMDRAQARSDQSSALDWSRQDQAQAREDRIYEQAQAREDRIYDRQTDLGFRNTLEAREVDRSKLQRDEFDLRKADAQVEKVRSFNYSTNLAESFGRLSAEGDAAALAYQAASRNTDRIEERGTNKGMVKDRDGAFTFKIRPPLPEEMAPEDHQRMIKQEEGLLTSQYRKAALELESETRRSNKIAKDLEGVQAGASRQGLTNQGTYFRDMDGQRFNFTAPAPLGPPQAGAPAARITKTLEYRVANNTYWMVVRVPGQPIQTRPATAAEIALGRSSGVIP